MLKVVLVIAIAVCFSSAFKLRTEATPETCDYSEPYVPYGSGKIEVNPDTGKPLSSDVLALRHYAYSVVLKCPTYAYASNIPEPHVVQTKVGKIYYTDYGSEYLFAYKPNPEKETEWTYESSNADYNDGCGSVTIGYGGPIYFDTKGKTHLHFERRCSRKC